MILRKWMELALSISALFLGMSLTLAFAPYEIYFLAIFIPALLLVIWINVTAKQALWLGFLFGLGFFGAGVHWVYISIHDFGDVPVPLALIITSGMIAILAMYPALVGFFLNKIFPGKSTTKIVCAFPVLWVVLEWARSHLFSGFAWFIIGYSQTNSPLSGYAPVLSVYGVSLAVLISSSFLLCVFLEFKQKKYKTAYLYSLGIVIIWVLGGLLNLIPWTKPNNQPISIALVQGAIPQQLKWSPDNLRLSVDRYQKLTEPLWGKHQIIIWPETAIPIALQDAALFIDYLDDKAIASNTTLILGIPIYIASKNGYQNAIVTLGKYKNTYVKRHLVPFGEYVPFSRWLFPLLNFMNIPTSDVVGPQATQDPIILDNLKIAASICYEITFPELIYINDKTIGFLLTVNNDAWFGKSNAQAQHLQMAKMRAIELRRPVVVVSNDGITAIIGPHGEISAAAPAYQVAVVQSKVQAMQGLTPWMKNGMDPLFFIMIVMFLGAIYYEKFAPRLSNSKIIVED